MRMLRDASRISDEIVQHLAGLVGVNVEVRLELRAEADSGVKHRAHSEGELLDSENSTLRNSNSEEEYGLEAKTLTDA